MKISLREVAFARSGDKGDTANIGVISIAESVYPFLVKYVTADEVKRYFRYVCKGSVERFELPNLFALNFLLHESFGGGGTVSLMLDAQGKTFAAALLGLEIDIPESVINECRRVVTGDSPARSADRMEATENE